MLRFERTTPRCFTLSLRGFEAAAKLKYGTAFVALICVVHSLATRDASAITAEVAKKCGELTAKAYPPRVPGNPAAGYANGTAEDFRKYFSKCVANGGNMDQTPESGKEAPHDASDKDSQAPK
jgi:hypothetical protein